MSQHIDIESVLDQIATSEEVIQFATTPARAFVLIAYLQLALRMNDGASAQIAHEITVNLIEGLCSVIPQARPLVESGWNPAYDMTREYFAEEFE